MKLLEYEEKAGNFKSQAEPYEFRTAGPPLAWNADIYSTTAEHINQITLEGTEHTEFGMLKLLICTDYWDGTYLHGWSYASLFV